MVVNFLSLPSVIKDGILSFFDDSLDTIIPTRTALKFKDEIHSLVEHRKLSTYVLLNPSFKEDADYPLYCFWLLISQLLYTNVFCFQFLFQQLGVIIAIVKQHIKNYLEDIFYLIKVRERSAEHSFINPTVFEWGLFNPISTKEAKQKEINPWTVLCVIQNAKMYAKVQKSVCATFWGLKKKEEKPTARYIRVKVHQ